MMMWQTIETAPKDGTQVLLYWANQDVKENDGFCRVCRFGSPYIGEWSDGEYSYSDPTHWMPIEAPE